MSSNSLELTDRPSESPDPASHASNIYDNEGDWVDEENDDDMDFEPTTEDDEQIEYFEATEDEENEFHGMLHRRRGIQGFATPGY